MISKYYNYKKQCNTLSADEKKREIKFKPEKKIAQRYVKDLMPFPPLPDAEGGKKGNQKEPH